LERLLHWNRDVIARAAPQQGVNHMKIYLLMLLIGTILSAIRFTSVPETRAETHPQ